MRRLPPVVFFVEVRASRYHQPRALKAGFLVGIAGREHVERGLLPHHVMVRDVDVRPGFDERIGRGGVAPEAGDVERGLAAEARSEGLGLGIG